MNEPELQGLFESEGLADGHQLEGPRAPDHTGKPLGATRAGKYAEIHFRQADFSCVLAGDANVAGERDFESASDRMSVQRGDYQLRRLFEARERFIRMQAKIIFEFRSGGGEHRDARAGAKEFVALAAQDDYVNTFVHARLEDGGIELLHQFIAVSIGRGIIEFENRDTVIDAVVKQNSLIGRRGG